LEKNWNKIGITGLNENLKEELQFKFQLKNSQRLLQQILSKKNN